MTHSKILDYLIQNHSSDNIPKNPGDLSKVALCAMTIAEEENIEITDSFVKFANTPANLDLIHNLERLGFDVGKSAPMELLSHYVYCRWAKAGLPVFRPSEGLAASLSLTDIDNVPTEDWHWPFKSFLIHVPYDFWIMESPMNGETDPISMVLVTYMESMYQEPAAIFLMIGKYGSLSYSQVILPDKPMLFGDWLPTLYKTNEHTIDSFDSFKLSQSEVQEMNKCCKMAINLCLYITEKGKGERQINYTTKKSRRKQQKEKVVAQPNVWIIGKEIKLSKDMIQMAHSQATDDALWRVKKRFVVRGHWRNQVCGKGRMDRRMTFIEPHFKGPKEGERLTHLYTDLEKVDQQ